MPNSKLTSLESRGVVESTGRREPWERLPDESPRAFAAFCAYRDAAENRRMQRVAEQLHCSGQNVRRWAARHSWVDRCWAYDVRQDELHCAAMSRDRMRMRERQAQVGMALQAIAAQALQELQERMKQGLPLNLSTDDICRLVDVGSRLERLARGEDKESRFTKIIVRLGRTEDEADEDVLGTTPVVH